MGWENLIVGLNGFIFIYPTYSFVVNCSRGLYCIAIFYPENHFIMTLPFYQNVKLGSAPTFYYQSPSPSHSSRNKLSLVKNVKSSAGVGNRTKTFYVPGKKWTSLFKHNLMLTIIFKQVYLLWNYSFYF